VNDNLLTETWGSTIKQTYTYDNTSHLKTSDDATSNTSNTYTYNAIYQLTDTTTNISHYHYTYDPGNRLVLTTGTDGNKAVDYSNDNQINTVTSDSHTIEYLYDAQDKRVGKKLDGIIQERYIYDGDDIALVVNAMGTLIEWYRTTYLYR
jgi:YD repeat-containing protein